LIDEFVLEYINKHRESLSVYKNYHCGKNIRFSSWQNIKTMLRFAEIAKCLQQIFEKRILAN